MTPRNFFVLLTCCACSLVLVACGGANTSNNNGNASPQASPAAPVVVEASPDASTQTKAAVPPAEAVHASAPGAEIRAGGSTQADVRVEIAEGYHVNANPPTHDYLRPTKVELVAEQGITAGEPTYPRALSKKFAFDPQPLAVYEREAIVKLPLRASGDAAKGTRSLRVKVTAQPCDDKTCYPPRTVETSIQLTIK